MALFTAKQISAQVLINEALPNPSAKGDDSEWVELYNYSAAEVDLSDYSLDGKQFAQAEIKLAPQNYLLVTANKQAFTAEFGDRSNVIQHDIGLTNSGDSLALEKNNEIVDELIYTDSEADKSWERTGPICAEVKLHSDSHSLGEVNQNQDLACFPESDDKAGQSDIPKVQFSFDEVIWQEQVNSFAGEPIYLRYKKQEEQDFDNAKFLDFQGQKVASPLKKRYYRNELKLEYQVGEDIEQTKSKKLSIYPKLRITEFAPFTEEYEWVEVYNPQSYEVNLYGLQIMNSRGVITELAAYELKPGEHKVLKLSGNQFKNCSQPTDCEDFIELRYGNLTVDKFAYQDSVLNQSWSLQANGDWQLNNVSSPGAENKEPAKTIQLSEVYPSPLSGEEEWLEVYNYGEDMIELDGWFLTDESQKKHALSGGIAAEQHRKIDDISFNLNNDGDRILLLAPNGEQVDKLDYETTQKGYAQAKVFSKGDEKYTSELVSSSSPTPAQQNVVTGDVGSKTSEARSQADTENNSVDKLQTDAQVKAVSKDNQQNIGNTQSLYKLPKLNVENPLPEVTQPVQQSSYAYAYLAMLVVASVSSLMLLTGELRQPLGRLVRSFFDWWNGY